MSVNFEYKMTTDLDASLERKLYPGPLVMTDSNAHKIRVKVKRGSTDVPVSSVSAYFLRSDKSTVAITGSSNGNEAIVILPQTAYAVPGGASLAVRATADGATNTIALIDFVVVKNSSDSFVDPGNVIPDIYTLFEKISEMESATAAAKKVVSDNESTISNLRSSKVNVSDIVDKLTSTASNVPLSAKQGKVLNDGKANQTDMARFVTSAGITPLKSGVDLNSITTVGLYDCNTACTNKPDGGACFVHVFTDGNIVKQIAYSEANDNVYTRRYYGGTWGSWVKISNEWTSLCTYFVPTGSSVSNCDCNWSGTSELMITVGTYGNVMDSMVVPTSYFSGTSDGRLAIINSDIYVQIYQNGNGSVTIKTSDATSDVYRVTIYGK